MNRASNCQHKFVGATCQLCGGDKHAMARKRKTQRKATAKPVYALPVSVSGVRTYDLKFNGGRPDMFVAKHGTWVRAEDYFALQDENDQLKKDHRRLTPIPRYADELDLAIEELAKLPPEKFADRRDKILAVLVNGAHELRVLQKLLARTTQERDHASHRAVELLMELNDPLARFVRSTE